MEQLPKIYINSVVDYGSTLLNQKGWLLREKNSPFVRFNAKVAGGMTEFHYPKFNAELGTIPNAEECERPLGSFIPSTEIYSDFTLVQKTLKYYNLSANYDTRNTSVREVKGFQNKKLWNLRVKVLGLIESVFASTLTTYTNYASTRRADGSHKWDDDAINPFTDAAYGMVQALEALDNAGYPCTDIIFGYDAWKALFKNKLAREHVNNTVIVQSGYKTTSAAPSKEDISNTITRENGGNEDKINIWIGKGGNYGNSVADSDVEGTVTNVWSDSVIFMHQSSNKSLSTTQDPSGGGTVGKAADITIEDISFAAYIIGDEQITPYEEVLKSKAGYKYDIAGAGFVMADSCGFLLYNVTA